MPHEIWNYHDGCWIRYVAITREIRQDAALVCAAAASSHEAYKARGRPWDCPSVGVVAHEMDMPFLADWVADQAITHASEYAFEDRFPEAEALLRTGWRPL